MAAILTGRGKKKRRLGRETRVRERGTGSQRWRESERRIKREKGRRKDRERGTE